MEIQPDNASVGSHGRPESHPEKFEVFIIYNGIKKPLEVRLHELIKAVLQKAIALFGALPNPHTLSLFTGSGQRTP
jgi:hypothetical protein